MEEKTKARHAAPSSLGQDRMSAHPRRPVGGWRAPELCALAVAVLGFALLLGLVIAGGRTALPIDEAALSLALSLRSPLLTSAMAQVSTLVMPAVLAVVALALTALGHGPRPGLAALLCAAAVTGLNWLVKQLVARPRPPEELRLAIETSTSFPSSHAVSAVAFFGFVIWLVWRSQRPGAWRNVQVALLVLAIVLIGASRVYLAVHYLSDVLAGYCLATACLLLFVRFVAPRILADH